MDSSFRFIVQTITALEPVQWMWNVPGQRSAQFTMSLSNYRVRKLLIQFIVNISRRMSRTIFPHEIFIIYNKIIIRVLVNVFYKWFNKSITYIDILGNINIYFRGMLNLIDVVYLVVNIPPQTLRNPKDFEKVFEAVQIS